MLTTPKGVAVYPHLTKPDTKFKAEGQWHIKVKYEQGHEGAEELAKTIDAAMAVSLKTTREEVAKIKGEKKAKMIGLADKPYSRDEDDGSLTFSFKMTAKGKSRKTGKEFEMKPVIYNAAGIPTEGMKIGGGSIVRVSYEMIQFPSEAANATPKVGAGVSLRLSAVQVIKLVEYGANAEFHGFKDESDDEDATTAPAAVAASEEDEPTPAKSGKSSKKVAEPEETDDF